jgi:hypothetical protein
MGSGVTDYGSPTWLGALFGVIPVPSGYYVALCVAEPGVAMDGAVLGDLEPDDTAYHRQFIALGSTRWGVSDSYITTLVDVDFGLASADWGQITHYALCSAPSGGNIFAWGEFLNPPTIQSGYQATIPAGGIVVALSALEAPIAV